MVQSSTVALLLFVCCRSIGTKLSNTTSTDENEGCLPFLALLTKYFGCFNTTYNVVDRNDTFPNRTVDGQTRLDCLQRCLWQNCQDLILVSPCVILPHSKCEIPNRDTGGVMNQPSIIGELHRNLEVKCQVCHISTMLVSVGEPTLLHCVGLPKLPGSPIEDIYNKTNEMVSICSYSPVQLASPMRPIPVTNSTLTPYTLSAIANCLKSLDEHKSTLATSTPEPEYDPEETQHNDTMTREGHADSESGEKTINRRVDTIEPSPARERPDSAPATNSGRPINCDLAHCRGVDIYGIEWCGNVDETVSLPCPGNATGTACRTCTLNGFDQIPDYTNCSSKWLEEIITHVEYKLSISPEAALNFLKIIETNCHESEAHGTNLEPPPYFSHEILPIFEITADIIVRVHRSILLRNYEPLNYYGIDVLRAVFVNQYPWSVLPGVAVSAEVGTGFLFAVERAVLELTRRVATNDTWMNENLYYRNKYGRYDMNISCGTQIIKKTQSDCISYPSPCHDLSGSYIRLPSDWAQYFPGREDIQFIGMELLNNYTNKIFPGSLVTAELQQMHNGRHLVINGKMMMFSVDSTFESLLKRSLNFTGEGVTIQFKHETMAWGTEVKQIRRRLHPGETPSPVLGTATCTYWDTENFSWSTNGCKVIQTARHFTQCMCYHLSSFAVLFSTHDYIGKNRILEIFTWILSTLSSICLTLCIIILVLCKAKSGRSPRSGITLHLCSNLLIGNILLLLFMDKHYLNLEKVLCALSGVLIHFFFLSAFCWMSIEAIQLYLMVIVVFDNGQDYKTTQMILAYGIPTFIIICTVVAGGIQGHYAYGGNEFCWLQDEFIWAFMGPVAFCLTINFGILVLCFRKVQTLNKRMKNQAGKTNIQSWIKGTASLTCLLGLSWISGFFMMVSSNPTCAEVFAFLFTLLNASQGFLLFVFHFAMNSEVQTQIKLRFYQCKAWSKNAKKRQSVTTLDGSSTCTSSSCRV